MLIEGYRMHHPKAVSLHHLAERRHAEIHFPKFWIQKGADPAWNLHPVSFIYFIFFLGVRYACKASSAVALPLRPESFSSSIGFLSARHFSDGSRRTRHESQRETSRTGGRALLTGVCTDNKGAAPGSSSEPVFGISSIKPQALPPRVSLTEASQWNTDKLLHLFSRFFSPFPWHGGRVNFLTTFIFLYRKYLFEGAAVCSLFAIPAAPVTCPDQRHRS